jgi:hypothetical protein
MNRRSIRNGAWALLLGVLMLAEPSWAINIVTNFQSSSSVNPTYDPAATQLQAMMHSVESYWEDIIEDSHTLTVNFWWDDMADEEANVLAVHQPTAVRNNRETACNIRFGTDWSWYFDADPADASEFNMIQTIYSDLTATNRSAFYNGETPDLLEAGYRGSAMTTAPQAARSGLDLFSVALHEVGHSLGMTGAVAPDEVDDYDYDVNPVFVGGASMAINTYSTGDVYHAKDNFALMYPYTYYATRTLPGATDVFAMAAASNWTQIDLPRKDYWGGSDWNTAFNWEGNRLPDSGDEVTIRHGGAVSLSGAGYAGKLIIDNASELIVSGGGTLQSSSISVTSQATIHLDGGTVQGSAAGASDLTIAAGASLTGEGTLMLDVVNFGSVSPGNGAGLIAIDGDFTQTSSGTLIVDLGGLNAGVDADLLAITGSADLSGLLDILLVDGFIPAPGNIFTILTYADYTGAFDDISNLILGSGLYLTADYQTNALDLIALHAVPGDANYDGLVDVGDLGILAGNYGLQTAGTWEMGDFNGDGMVNVGDLGILAGHYGDASSGMPQTVPEPSVLGLLTFALAAFRTPKPKV